MHVSQVRICTSLYDKIHVNASVHDLNLKRNGNIHTKERDINNITDTKSKSDTGNGQWSNSI